MCEEEKVKIMETIDWVNMECTREIVLQPNYGKMDNLDLALRLSTLGWYVFPQGQNKRPIVEIAHPEGDPLRYTCKGECGRLGHGYHDAVTGFDAVIDLWERAGARNTAVVGINCEKSGILGMDIDHHPGRPDGYKGLEYFLNKSGETEIICGPIQTTPGGGEHYLFKMPPMPDDWVMPGRLTIEDAEGKKRECGIDLKYNGAISTGALLDGRAYRRKPGHGFDTPLTYPPAWVLRYIAAANAPKESKYDGKEKPVSGNRPGDDYQRRHTWEEVIKECLPGWFIDGERVYREDKKRGVKATLRDGVFYIFTEAGLPGNVKSRASYNKFSLLTDALYDGSFHAAAKDLLAKGYGGE